MVYPSFFASFLYTDIGLYRPLEAPLKSNTFRISTRSDIFKMLNLLIDVINLYLLWSSVSVNIDYFDYRDIILDANQQPVYFCDI